jgi:hypothetical protein
VPGADPTITPDGSFLILEAPSVNLANYDANFNYIGEQATTAELTFSTSGPFPAMGIFAPVCFAAGTRIRTERGEIAVEDLARGDLVHVFEDGAGAVRQVIWIGYRDVNLVSHPDPFEVQPIRIRRDAFAENVPCRDLLVSPAHAVFADGVLIPARLLLNGATIVRETRLSKVRYFHVELDRHSVLFSENLPSESYLDTGNRSFFQNGGQVIDLNVGLAAILSPLERERYSCAPFVCEPDAVLPVWTRLARRAGDLGCADPANDTTTDPAVRLLVDGNEVQPLCVADGQYSFVLPPGTREVRLLSRAARPCDTRPWLGDPRVLGVSVSRVRLRHRQGVDELALDGPAAVRGWQDVEHDGVRMWRWTNGDAVLRLPDFVASGSVLELTMGGMIYPLETAAAGHGLGAIAKVA